MRLVSLIFLTLAIVSTGFSQSTRDIDPELSRHRTWIETSHGPAFIPHDILLVGPSVSVAWLSPKKRFMKVKIAYHSGLDFFENFPQSAFEFNVMSAWIQKSKGPSLEVHYGLGMILGRKHGELLPPSQPGFNFDLTAHYEEDQFTTIGIPLEVRVQFKKIFGVGVAGNLNLKMPYAGVKLFTRFGLPGKK